MSITVNQAVPTITWAAPGAITYGTALSATQLNATGSVAGTTVYSPVSGTVLSAGRQPGIAGDLHAGGHDGLHDGNVHGFYHCQQGDVDDQVGDSGGYPLWHGVERDAVESTGSVAGTTVYSPVSGTELSLAPARRCR